MTHIFRKRAPKRWPKGRFEWVTVEMPALTGYGYGRVLELDAALKTIFIQRVIIPNVVAFDMVRADDLLREVMKTETHMPELFLSGGGGAHVVVYRTTFALGGELKLTLANGLGSKVRFIEAPVIQKPGSGLRKG